MEVIVFGVYIVAVNIFFVVYSVAVIIVFGVYSVVVIIVFGVYIVLVIIVFRCTEWYLLLSLVCTEWKVCLWGVQCGRYLFVVYSVAVTALTTSGTCPVFSLVYTVCKRCPDNKFHVLHIVFGKLVLYWDISVHK